jgi:thiamine-phosphate pyrophosphorylase
MPAVLFRALAVSGRAGLPGGDLAGWLRALAAAGIDAVQLREKDLADRALYELARLARAVLPTARLLVNGRADVALAAGADGVHLPVDGPPAAALRARFGPGLVIGVSTHRVEEVERARRDGADYAVFGPVYATPAKARYGPPAGLAELARAAATGIPVVALGGITLERLGEVASTGAAGVAGIRLFQPPSDLDAVLAAIRRTFPAGLPRPQDQGVPGGAGETIRGT